MADDHPTTETGWDVGLTQDDRTGTMGISIRRRFTRNGERFVWRSGATASEIAAQLREAALYLEGSADDE